MAALTNISNSVAILTEDRTENGSKVDPSEYYTGFYFDIEGSEFFLVDRGVEHTEKIASISKKYVKKYLSKFINNMGKSAKTEKQSVSTVSKTFLEDIIAFYFATGNVVYSAALKYEIYFHDKKYTGYSDHAVKVKDRNLCVLVWEDKFDSHVPGGDFLKAICQTGLEILGELRRLQTMRRIFPKEYCGVLTNGRDWVLVSCLISESGEKSWRHSRTLCVVKDGNSGSNPVADDDAVASVAKLLEYAFDRANSILALINSPQSFRLSSTPEESADGDVDDDDEVGKTCDMLESTDVFNAASSSTRRDGGGSGKGHKGGGDSGNGRCHSGADKFFTLTSDMKRLHDKENMDINKSHLEQKKNARIRSFLDNNIYSI